MHECNYCKVVKRINMAPFLFMKLALSQPMQKQLPYNYWPINKIVIAYDIRQLAKTKMILIVRSAVENTEVIILKEAKLMHTGSIYRS